MSQMTRKAQRGVGRRWINRRRWSYGVSRFFSSKGFLGRLSSCCVAAGAAVSACLYFFASMQLESTPEHRKSWLFWSKSGSRTIPDFSEVSFPIVTRLAP